MVIVANASVILGRSDDIDDDSAGENVRSTGLDSQPSVSVVLLKTRRKSLASPPTNHASRRSTRVRALLVMPTLESTLRESSLNFTEKGKTQKLIFYQKMENKYFSILKL